jgi:hypothetical protein
MKKKELASKMSSKEKYKKGMSTVRKYLREKGKKTIEPKSYYEYSTKERANIRTNSKVGSNAYKWANEREEKPEGAKEWRAKHKLPY